MDRIAKLALAGAALLALSGCGHNTEQRAATGAATGLVLGGPVGAAIGAGAGVVISRSQDKR